MRLIQPKPNHEAPVVKPVEKVPTHVPVYHVRYRYTHHAEASGYDRLCDFVGETIELSDCMYWAGETVLRPYCLWEAKNGGHYEYSRYDCVMELEALRHFLRHEGSVYHFVYAEKSFKRMARWSQSRNNWLVGTMHHPYEHTSTLFRNGLEHFKALDALIVMSPDLVKPWEAVTGKKNVWYVPHGVDVDYFHPGQKGEGGVRRCVFVGSHERDFSSLPAIVRKILTECPSVIVDLVSANPICGELAAADPRCHWHSELGSREYRLLMGAADMLLLPLVKSTACNAVLEAMACGMIVLSSRGGIETYLTPDCSIVVDSGDVNAFVRAAVEVLQDERSLAEMQGVARRNAINFSWEKVARQTAQVYERASRL